MSTNKTRTINFEGLKEILRDFYENNELEDSFKKDIIYLEKAFDEIYELWIINFDQMKEIKYIMIAEAPLWGREKKYIYNPATNNSQFFFRSDLEYVAGEKILTKEQFLKACIKIGLIFLDISPYPLNQIDTVINYRNTKNLTKGLPKIQYLIQLTLHDYFEKKLELISNKKSNGIKIFFRYQRVKENFEDLIIPALLKHEIIQSKYEMGEVSKAGGGIDRLKLSKRLNSCEIKVLRNNMIKQQ